MLDSGTTTKAIASALKCFLHLTIIANAVNITIEPSGTDFEGLLPRRFAAQNSFSRFEPLAEDMRHDMNADVLFLRVERYDRETGSTVPNVLEFRINLAIVKAILDSGHSLRFSEAQSAQFLEDCRFFGDPPSYCIRRSGA